MFVLSVAKDSIRGGRLLDICGLTLEKNHSFASSVAVALPMHRL